MRTAFIRNNLRVFLSVLGLLTPVALAVAYMLVIPGLRRMEDVAPAKPEQAIVTVERVSFHPGARPHPTPMTRVHVRVAGRAAEGYTKEPVQVGQKVRISYRIGTSGHVQIQAVRPLDRVKISDL